MRDQGIDDFGLFDEIRVRRHRSALADGAATVLDDVRDVVILDAVLPGLVLEVARLGAQTSRARTVASARGTVANRTAAGKDLGGFLLRSGGNRRRRAATVLVTARDSDDRNESKASKQDLRRHGVTSLGFQG